MNTLLGIAIIFVCAATFETSTMERADNRMYERSAQQQLDARLRREREERAARARAIRQNERRNPRVGRNLIDELGLYKPEGVDPEGV